MSSPLEIAATPHHPMGAHGLAAPRARGALAAQDTWSRRQIVPALGAALLLGVAALGGVVLGEGACVVRERCAAHAEGDARCEPAQQQRSMRRLRRGRGRGRTLRRVLRGQPDAVRRERNLARVAHAPRPRVQVQRLERR
eukprot:4617763-Prymnesium_polylepis.1